MVVFWDMELQPIGGMMDGHKFNNGPFPPPSYFSY